MISAWATISERVLELELDEVVEGVFELQLPIPFENGRVNVFIFRDGRELDLRSGVGNLDLDKAMSGRLVTWRFSF